MVTGFIPRSSMCSLLAACDASYFGVDPYVIGSVCRVMNLLGTCCVSQLVFIVFNILRM